jgi:hypothetical protein
VCDCVLRGAVSALPPPLGGPSRECGERVGGWGELGSGPVDEDCCRFGQHNLEDFQVLRAVGSLHAAVSRQLVQWQKAANSCVAGSRSLDRWACSLTHLPSHVLERPAIRLPELALASAEKADVGERDRRRRRAVCRRRGGGGAAGASTLVAVRNRPVTPLRACARRAVDHRAPVHRRRGAIRSRLSAGAVLGRRAALHPEPSR